MVIDQAYIDILREELVPAMGCTEPIAIAYAAAKARRVLEMAPTAMRIYCSGNIIKNVMGVVVPNSGGLRGAVVAALLGMLGGDDAANLSVLEAIKPEHIERMNALLQQRFCQCLLVEDEENLYIRAELETDEHSASVEIRGKHTDVYCIKKDGKIIYQCDEIKEAKPANQEKRELLNVRDILAFADRVPLEELWDVLSRQIAYNDAIAIQGVKGTYGESVGRLLLESAEANDIDTIACAMAAAGSDARMNGCSLPVVINSGSGNQGITASVPLVYYGRYYHIDEDRLYRALAVSNLISIHQKRFIGSLSAYCGAVSAACGCAAGISYMLDGSYKQVCMTITNTIATIGGMVCDGAKSSCAAKIAAAVRTALTSYKMSLNGKVFQPGEGLVKRDVEETIASVGRMGRVGMHSTDVEILNIMLERS